MNMVLFCRFKWGRPSPEMVLLGMKFRDGGLWCCLYLKFLANVGDKEAGLM